MKSGKRRAANDTAVDIYEGDKEEEEEDEQVDSVTDDAALVSQYQTPEGKASSDFKKKKFGARVTPRASAQVGTYAVQCVNCLKWRMIPTKEIYEDIRHRAGEDPFVCDVASQWRQRASCGDPPDISPDNSHRLWVMDRPSIPRPPQGWDRLISIRGVTSSKFADVYYISPCGKKLRSGVEIQRFLEQNPHYVEEGVTLSQFDYKCPRPFADAFELKKGSP
eukprot:TRINITY_DN1303_c0_g1_i1.p2 TRINITY_DN1303_c0_g1~~TRINITY_DN1303_c0_g1_i1.p2  ORF type:complete len:221 (-),score=7.93 TRINITY_DN1303_c0_g1_i1:396-1058(-)